MRRGRRRSPYASATAVRGPDSTPDGGLLDHGHGVSLGPTFELRVGMGAGAVRRTWDQRERLDRATQRCRSETHQKLPGVIFGSTPYPG